MELTKFLILFYSNTGSNKYLAHKIAEALYADIEELIPKIGMAPILLMLSSMNKGIGYKPLKHDIDKYETVILVGPIWMGKLIAPLRGFLNRFKSATSNLIFVTCCGSSDEKKLEKFGHGIVFNEIQQMLGERCRKCQAFPIDLVLPEDKKYDSDLIMQTRLNDTNFSGQIKDRFDQFIAATKTIS